MKKTLMLISAATFGALLSNAGATYMEAPACEDPEIIVPDSTGFKFTDVIALKTTPVKDQNKSGTCWCFSGLSVLEEDVLRKGGPELDLSEMFTVRQAYIDKAKRYIRTGGKINFAQGGGFGDVLESVAQYGTVPEEVFNGLNYGEEKHAHYEMAEVLKAYLDAILMNKNKKLSTAWLDGYIGILDAYLGKAPEEFTYNGKKYTPLTFAKEMGVAPQEFISLVSYTHHPFYQEFALEIPDNWQWLPSTNLPLDEFKTVVDKALENGYSIGWAADVSEPGFKWRKGYALIPEKKNKEDMDNTELSRWVQLSDQDREKSAYDIKGPVKEITVTQESRQEGFDNLETTDDHGMTIVGVATDQEGNRYYKVKNSWDTNQLYNGFFYVSEPYFMAKTISVIVNKNAIPKDIAKKIAKK